MSHRPLFSVIIPTRHRNDMLAKCLGRLDPLAQSLASELYEVIVTDDGVDTTAERMVRERYGWAKWVPGPRRGPAANRNNGAGYAKGEWLVFTDDDCIPDTQWLEAYATSLVADPPCTVLEGRTYTNESRSTLAQTAPINETGGHLWSCNFAIERKFFESLAGFDERYLYACMEDVDLRLRIQEAGREFSFVKAAAVCHPLRLKGGWEALKQYQQSIFLYLSLHPDERKNINPSYYLKGTLRGLVKTTLPGLLRYQGKGVTSELLEYVAFLQLALRLCIK